MICYLWRTGFSTQKLIRYRYCIWATSPCLAAWHSLSECGHLPPPFLKDCRYQVQELLRWGSLLLNHCATWTLGFYCQAEGTRTQTWTLSTHLYVFLYFFFSLSLITCRSGTDSLCDSFIGCMALTLVETVRTPQLSKRISSSHVLQWTNTHTGNMYFLGEERRLYMAFFVWLFF